MNILQACRIYIYLFLLSFFSLYIYQHSANILWVAYQLTFIIVLLEIPLFYAKKYKVSLDYSKYTAIALVLNISLDQVGVYFKLYEITTWYDDFMHIGVMNLILFSFALTVSKILQKTKIISENKIYELVHIMIIIAALTVVHEIIEFGLTYFSGDENFVAAQGDVYDTQRDLKNNLFGSLFITGIYALVRRKK
jgi:uncharacterized membrane protein YjdF